MPELNWNIISNHGPDSERSWDLENVHQDSCGDGWLERQAAEWHRCWALSFDLLKHDNDQNWSPCPLLNVGKVWVSRNIYSRPCLMPFQTSFPHIENHMIQVFKQCAFFGCSFLVVHPHAAHHRVWSTCCYPPMVVWLTSAQWSQPLSMCIYIT